MNAEAAAIANVAEQLSWSVRIRTCTALARGRVSNSHKQMRGNLDVHKAAQAVSQSEGEICFGKKTGVVEPRNTKGTEN